MFISVSGATTCATVSHGTAGGKFSDDSNMSAISADSQLRKRMAIRQVC